MPSFSSTLSTYLPKLWGSLHQQVQDHDIVRSALCEQNAALERHLHLERELSLTYDTEMASRVRMIQLLQAALKANEERWQRKWSAAKVALGPMLEEMDHALDELDGTLESVEQMLDKEKVGAEMLRREMLVAQDEVARWKEEAQEEKRLRLEMEQERSQMLRSVDRKQNDKNNEIDNLNQVLEERRHELSEMDQLMAEQQSVFEQEKAGLTQALQLERDELESVRQRVKEQDRLFRSADRKRTEHIDAYDLLHADYEMLKEELDDSKFQRENEQREWRQEKAELLRALEEERGRRNQADDRTLQIQENLSSLKRDLEAAEHTLKQLETETASLRNTGVEKDARIRKLMSTKGSTIDEAKQRKRIQELEEEVDGLNIALDYQQQELKLIKRKHGVTGTGGTTPAVDTKAESIPPRRGSSVFGGSTPFGAARLTGSTISQSEASDATVTIADIGKAGSRPPGLLPRSSSFGGNGKLKHVRLSVGEAPAHRRRPMSRFFPGGVVRESTEDGASDTTQEKENLLPIPSHS